MNRIDSRFSNPISLPTLPTVISSETTITSAEAQNSVTPESEKKTFLTAREREERLRTEDTIPKRLATQMERAQLQMQAETVREFKHVRAPQDWAGHEEVVDGVNVGLSDVQGRKPAMEDEYLAAAFKLEIAGRTHPVRLFGIFDGHGGRLAARFVKENLAKKLQEVLVEFNPEGLTDTGIWNALKMACVRLNRDLESTHAYETRNQGTTATIAMLLDNKLWTANVGDSRTILDNNGVAVQLSRDAKPDDPLFRAGIEHRGGIVRFTFGIARINSILSVARAMGDYALRGVSARPTITMIPLSEIQSRSHLILCSDGVYEVARTIDVMNLAYRSTALSVAQIAKDITYSAYQAGSSDNLAALVVKMVEYQSQ